MIRKQLAFDQVNKSESNEQIKPAHQQLNFIQKAYELVNNPKNSQIIHWSKSGLTFIIQDIERFQKDLLPLYFRHNRYQSFVRQLNMYDFHKIRNGDYYCDNKSEFRHDEFSKDNVQSIYQIKRKGFQAKNKQKENTKIKKCHKITQKKNLKKRKINPIKQVREKKVLQLMLDQNQNSFFVDLPRSRENLFCSYTSQNREKIFQKIIQKVVQIFLNKSQRDIHLKKNKINETIQIAQQIKQQWMQNFQKISGSEDISSMKDIYYKVKQQLHNKIKVNNVEKSNEAKKSPQIQKGMQFQLLQIIEQQNAVIQSIFRAEIKSTLICITSETFLNHSQAHRKYDTLLGI